MNAYLLIAWDFAGYLLGLCLGIAMLVGIGWYQYQEYQRWPYAKKSYWIIKVATPVLFGLALLVVMAIASGISGMEALGVFYFGMLALVAIVPATAAVVGRFFGLSFKESLTSAGSLFAVLLGLSFALGMLVNTGGALVRMDFGYLLNKYEQRLGRQNPKPADDRVSLGDEKWFLLPDGQKLLVLNIRNEPDLSLEKIETRVSADGAINRFRNVRNICAEDDQLLIQIAVKESTEISLRMLWRSDEGYFGDEYPFVVPTDNLAYIQLFYHQGLYELPVTFPSNGTNILQGEESRPSASLLESQFDNRKALQTAGFRKNPCIPTAFSFPELDALEVTLYSDDTKDFTTFQLLPRNVPPAFR